MDFGTIVTAGTNACGYVKDNTVKAYNWAKDKAVILKDGLKKVYEFVKEFLSKAYAACKNFAFSRVDWAKKFIPEHKEGVAVGVGAAILAIVALIIFRLAKTEETPAPVKTPE